MDAFVLIEASNIHFTFAYLFASLDDDGSNALFDEGECGKESSRAGSYDKYLSWGVAYMLIVGGGIRRQLRFIGRKEGLNGEEHFDVTLTRIDRSLGDAPCQNCLRRQLQLSCYCLLNSLPVSGLLRR